MKTCTTCGESRPLTSFNKDSQKKDGLNPRCKKCSRAWHHKNKQRVRGYQQAYYQEKKERHSEKARAYRAENRDKLNQNKREWYKKNKKRASEYRRERSERYAAHARNRRARLSGSGGSHTVEDIERLKAFQKMRCSICRCSLDSYHVDHIVPIAKGGGNDFLNIQLLCPACNLSKNDKDPIEYNQQRGFLL